MVAERGRYWKGCSSVSVEELSQKAHPKCYELVLYIEI